ncbi:MAG: CBU_0585 family protein [Candidatus Berkiellales bacterium]
MAAKNKKIYRTGYISEIDAFLREFDQKRTKFPESRRKEVEKFKKIFAKRDGTVQEQADFIWKEF